MTKPMYFLKTKEYNHLNLLLEGGPVEFNLKGKTKVVKTDNPLIVMAGNQPFDDIMVKYFPKQYMKEVMVVRVESLELKSRVALHFLISCVFGWDKDQPIVELPDKVLDL